MLDTSLKKLAFVDEALANQCALCLTGEMSASENSNNQDELISTLTESTKLEMELATVVCRQVAQVTL